MYSVCPRVPESAHDLRLATLKFPFAILNVAISRRDLPIRVEFNPIRSVHVDALDLASKCFFFGEAGHDVQGIPEDHAVRPMLIVLVEIQPILLVDPIEVRKEVWLLLG